jgi:hypothetical protein
MAAQSLLSNHMQFPMTWRSEDKAVFDLAFRAVDEALSKGRLKSMPFGWEKRTQVAMLERRETDWVLAARELFRIAVAVARDPSYDGEALVGPLEAERAAIKTPTWLIKDAPLFTDQMPNADILNN